jgi:ABC-type nitrate/sulfonate/bicarbonate transport system substrate-binding protein
VRRRTFVARGAAALAGLFGPMSALTAAAASTVRISMPSPGSAGSIWKPLVDGEPAGAVPGVALEWVGGDPGQVQTQLLAHALDVSVFGALGAGEVNARGAGVVIFGAALNNHGRWIVRGGSGYRAPRDVRGKRIATQPETSDTYRQARIAAALNGLDLARDYQIVHGPSSANLALFARGDVEAVIAIEPTATRLVAAGAQEIARVGDMWRHATGDGEPLLLVGHATTRPWFEANRPRAAAIARLLARVNEEIRARPQLLAEHHDAMGIPAAETAAIALLPSRLADIYAVGWTAAVQRSLDRQLDAAVKLGIIPRRPPEAVYADAVG